MKGKTRPVSIRLATSEIEQLHARAHTLSATIADVLARIAAHPAHRLDELLPWNWTLASAISARAA
jgi:hypothetical protein